VKKGVVYEKPYALELIRIACADFEAAEVLFAARVKRQENIFLMAQQALEKALKAVLCALGLPVPHLYEISLLLDRLPEEIDPPFGNQFNSLTEYATIRRYLEGKETHENEVTEAALKEIKNAVEWCSQKVDEVFKSNA
jgi:HEPN domain-containing protein